MIFTRCFGALRARPTFPSRAPEMTVEEADALRKAEYEAERAARAQARARRRKGERIDRPVQAEPVQEESAREKGAA